MLKKLFRSPVWERMPLTRTQVVAVAGIVVLAGGGALFFLRGHDPKPIEASSQSKRLQRYQPTEAQWKTLSVETVASQVFRAEHVTEGKIAVDEDRATPIFSPYAGRVTKLLVKPGDDVQRGQPLFVVEATDMVQTQNDFIGALTAMNKARSRLNLAQIIEKRNRDLYEGKAVALKELQNAQAELTGAQNDMRSAEVALEASRNRLRILGRSDTEIAAFEQKGTISAETTISAPIAGTIVQRKVGPGQYVSSGSSDPVFVIGDLSTVWLLAYVRESEAPNVRTGQAAQFTVLAYPSETFPANIAYVATAVDPNTRRLLVRATVNNARGLLKPEMFANVTILTGKDDAAPAIPREAVLYEGDSKRAWVMNPDRSIELRQIKTGLLSGRMLQVTEGLKIGDNVITRGSLFIDRAAAGS